jgi:hypothetical protein
MLPLSLDPTLVIARDTSVTFMTGKVAGFPPLVMKIMSGSSMKNGS